MKCGYMINLSKGTASRWVPCGQCMNCRINKKRTWTGKIVLESRYQDDISTFLTLTYDESNLPDRGSLQPRDPVNFINRLRARREISALGNLRFFTVGEYGSRTWRPHYHLSLFGISPEHEKIMQECWPHGHIMAGEVTHESASYIAGYTTKKLSAHDDPRIEDTGLHPEFARMSKRPPLGASGYINQILPNLMTRPGAAAIAAKGDVPTAFRIGGRTYPIGSYWRKWLRNQLNIENPPEYEPWAIDPDQFHEDMNNAAKKAHKFWKQEKSSTGRTL